MALAGGDELAGLVVPADVVSVYDGDTITVDAHPWLDMTIRARVRLVGINTPEIEDAKCAAERAAGERAKARLVELVGKRVVLTELDHDKYGGRIDARVLTAAGDDLTGILLAEQLGEPYSGGKRRDWCKWLAARAD